MARLVRVYRHLNEHHPPPPSLILQYSVAVIVIMLLTYATAIVGFLDRPKVVSLLKK